MRYQDEIQCAADAVVKKLRTMALETSNSSDFYAIHARRNDFQYRLAKISASDIIENLKPIEIPRGALVFLATDDPKGQCKGCLWQRKPCDTYRRPGRESKRAFAAADVDISWRRASHRRYPVPRPKHYGCPDDPSWDAFSRDAGWRVAMLGDFTKDAPLRAGTVHHPRGRGVACA